MKHKKTKRVLFITILSLVVFSATALSQQIPVYTLQEMVRPGINPAYTGLNGVYDLVILGRQQWIGITDAFKSYYQASNIPLRKRKAGMELVLQNQASGPCRHTGLFLNYSYTVQIGEAYFLSFGLRAGLNTYSIELSDLWVIDQGDYLFENDVNNLFLPYVGTGCHFQVRNYHNDFSVPLLIRNKFRPEDAEKTGKQNREERMYSFQTGAEFALSEVIKLQPEFALWLARGTPPVIDLRLSGSFSGYFTYKISENLVLGYAYELPLADHYQPSSGTHEVVLGLDSSCSTEKLCLRGDFNI